MILHRGAGAREVAIALPDGDHITQVMADPAVGWYERPMLEDMAARGPRGLAIDVGACFGTHAVWMAAVLGMDVLAIEPNPKALPYLHDNAGRNQLPIRVLEAAAGNRRGYVEPKTPAPNNMGSTPMRLLRRDAVGTIPMLTIDSIEGLADVGLIKIDVEGMEVRVLQGAAATIRRWQPLVYVEAQRETYPEVLSLMRSYGYRQVGKWNKTPTYGFAPLDRTPPATVRLSAAIMAHHKRERWIPYLHERMGADVPVVWDERSDRWDTGRRAMLAYDPEATHHIVVQDDAILPRDFLPGVQAAVAHVPDNPVCLYTGRVRPNHIFVEHMVRRAQAEGAHWIVFDGPWWGPAVVVPTHYIDEMVAWADRLTHIANYDRRMSRFFLDRGVDCYYSVPSLVSHRDGPENPSLVPGRGNEGRVAFNFIGEEASALEVEWGPGAVWPTPQSPPRRSP